MKQNRKLLRSLLKFIPEPMLFEIPRGFRNSIWWNLAHIIAIQQILLYRFSGQTARVEDSWIDTYMKGTLPSGIPDQQEIEFLQKCLIDSAIWAEEDYEKGIFKEYKDYTTSTKVLLSSIDDAINFNNYHEGLHLGVILSQLKVLGIKLG
jgi:hypothetical protein